MAIAKAPARKKKMPPKLSPPPEAKKESGLLLRGADGQEWKVGRKPTLGMARSWAYVLRNRNRWLRSKTARQDLAARALADLEQLEITQSVIDSLSKNSVVEVEIPFVAEEEGWAERIFPWEFVLHAAFRSSPKAAPVLVIRHLKCSGAAPARAPMTSPKLMVVESMPGRLTDFYTLDSLMNEEKLVASNLELEPNVVQNPTLEVLAGEVKKYKPSIIHFAGIDNHQAAGFLGRLHAAQMVDGLIFPDHAGDPTPASAVEVAKAVNPSKTVSPKLVTFNCFNTGARVAAMTVAEGTAAAIGFRDEVDDVVAEMLLARFYRAYKLSGKWDLLEAFKSAVNSVEQERNVLTGTGVVLWSRSSLIAGTKRTEAKASQITESVRQESLKPLPDEIDLMDALKVEVVPNEQLNYSLLHNNRNVFQTFKILKMPAGVLRGVQVQVHLQVGGESFPYVISQDLSGPVWDLSGLVRIGLTSELARTISEGIKTTLAVNVTCRGNIIYQQTHRVTLLPIDQWQDTEKDRIWLPSFVLPRDPAIVKIVDAAQRYLVALTDRMDAGFLGYQPADWPVGAGDLQSTVDTQVRALWWALLSELPLSYINPPPTFTYESQRVRTPTEIIEGRRGTCIDLALMMAACLEYVDIYPVVFLFSGHAYPGYCASQSAHDKLSQLFYENLGPESEKEASESSSAPRYRAWMLGKEAYPKLLQLVDDGDLIPLETVAMTRRDGFGNAVQQARDRFKTQPQTFEWIFDITLARVNDVTPLPCVHWR